MRRRGPLREPPHAAQSFSVTTPNCFEASATNRFAPAFPNPPPPLSYDGRLFLANRVTYAYRADPNCHSVRRATAGRRRGTRHRAARRERSLHSSDDEEASSAERKSQAP